MKVIAIAAIAAACCMPVFSAASQNQDTIVVASAPTVAQWTQSVGTNLDTNLRRIAPSQEGVVSVRFRSSEEGKPTAIQLSKRAASGSLNVAAQRAVKNLKSLHPLPQGVGDDQVYEASIIVASSQRDIDRHVRDLKLAYAKRDGAENVLAFVVASSSTSRS